MHLKVIFQLLMCRIDADTTTVVCTSGLEIEFYPNLTPRMSSLALLETEIPYPVDITGKNNVDFFWR